MSVSSGTVQVVGLVAIGGSVTSVHQGAAQSYKCNVRTATMDASQASHVSEPDSVIAGADPGIPGTESPLCDAVDSPLSEAEAESALQHESSSASDKNSDISCCMYHLQCNVTRWGKKVLSMLLYHRKEAKQRFGTSPKVPCSRHSRAPSCWYNSWRASHY